MQERKLKVLLEQVRLVIKGGNSILFKWKHGQRMPVSKEPSSEGLLSSQRVRFHCSREGRRPNRSIYLQAKTTDSPTPSPQADKGPLCQTRGTVPTKSPLRELMRWAWEEKDDADKGQQGGRFSPTPRTRPISPTPIWAEAADRCLRGLPRLEALK